MKQQKQSNLEKQFFQDRDEKLFSSDKHLCSLQNEVELDWRLTTVKYKY